MKFIFPKNYNFKNKFLGFIDYTTIFINIIWDGLIFLFINGFRIPPYGDVGNDWLALDQRKAQGTRRYLGSRDIIGHIEITDENNDFQIISSREGIVNNEEFQYYKQNHGLHYPGGESLFQVVHRVYSFLEELENKYPDKNILVVCHGGIVRVIHSYFHDMTNEELMTWLPENCCIQSYEK